MEDTKYSFDTEGILEVTMESIFQKAYVRINCIQSWRINRCGEHDTMVTIDYPAGILYLYFYGIDALPKAELFCLRLIKGRA